MEAPRRIRYILSIGKCKRRSVLNNCKRKEENGIDKGYKWGQEEKLEVKDVLPIEVEWVLFLYLNL